MTRTFVETSNDVEGFHRWERAPEPVAFLRDRHRHVFKIRCRFEVDDGDREIEIFMKQKEIKDFLLAKFGFPCEFGGLSCEHIAAMLVDAFPGMVRCSVLEDGFGGGTVER